MNRIPKTAIEDDDPTVEEEILNVDPTRPETEHHALSLDYTGEFASGVVDHDDRGQARWKWKTEDAPAASADRTFDLLKALDNDAISIEKEPQEVRTAPPRQSGYNPYDVGGPTQRKSRRKPR
jgi:hypothetical protein